MTQFTLKNGVLHAEAVALPAIAEQFGTPAYVYSRAALTESLKEFHDVLGAHPAGAGALVYQPPWSQEGLRSRLPLARRHGPEDGALAPRRTLPSPTACWMDFFSAWDEGALRYSA